MKSLRRRLLLWLLLGQLVVVAVAGFVTFNQVRHEVDELMDNQLRQLAAGLSVSASFHPIADKLEPVARHDDEFLVQVNAADGRISYSSHPAVALPLPPQRGYTEQTFVGERWRIFVVDRQGATIQVAQPFAERREASAEVAFAALGPLLALIPFLSLLVWFAVGRSLQPLQRIGSALGERTPSVLTPLPLQDLPSEIVPLVVALNDLLLRLEVALESQRRFVADAAHELRTPLTALHLQTQLLGRAQNDEERRLALSRVGASTTRAVHLVQQLLILARLEPDGWRSPMAPVALAPLARAVIAEQAQFAVARAIDLGFQQGDDQVQVVGDGDSLRVMIGNLVDNAIRYTPAGGRIDVSVTEEDTAAVIAVVDTGSGIPPAERERVFDRFYRRLGSGVAGSGLGLAIVREVVKRHGGEVVLDDPPDHSGLRVTVRLPRLP